MKKQKSTSKSSFVAGKHLLRRSIQIALAGSVLVSGMASAVLLDRGAQDPTFVWPQWYRDTNGMAVGLCKSTSLMCFPAAPDPTGFPGNVGPEVFYNLAEFKNLNTGSDFRYRIMMGLESSYAPVGQPIHGTEVVFARIRIGFNFNDCDHKNGTYKVIHPYGEKIFENVTCTTTSNVWGAGVAIFDTVDVPVLDPLNFDAPLHSAVGPFLQWDDGAGNPVILDGPIAGEKFLGDPTVTHSFTGSPFGTNFLRIEGPVGSNLDGLGNDFIQDDVATVLGQVWTAPIPAKVIVDKSIVTSSGTTNAVDVWATAINAPNLNGTAPAAPKLFMTAPGMPSLQMLPDGNIAGQYHGHVEFASTTAAPGSVSVTDVNSIPQVTRTAGVTDAILVKQATYDNLAGLITLVAHSSDEVRAPAMSVTGIPGLLPINSGLTAAKCTAANLVVAAGDVCLQTTLSAAYEVPKSVAITSNNLGVSEETYVQILGKTEAPAGAPAATTYTAQTVNSAGITALATQIPVGAVIVTQPANGLVTLVAGQWVFTANAGTAAGSDSFTYVTQNATTLAVSPLSTVPLTMVFSAKAPTAVNDVVSVSTASRTAKAINVLANDKPSSANALDNISPSTVTIVSNPTRGTVSVNAVTGIINYTPTSTRVTATDTFTYTVKNSANPKATSNTATVTVQLFPANEVVAVTKALFTAATNRWGINGTTSYFSAALTNTLATCWVGTGATPTPVTLIGSALVDNVGGFAVAPAPGVGANAGTNTALRCQTSVGGVPGGLVSSVITVK